MKSPTRRLLLQTETCMVCRVEAQARLGRWTHAKSFIVGVVLGVGLEGSTREWVASLCPEHRADALASVETLIESLAEGNLS